MGMGDMGMKHNESVFFGRAFCHAENEGSYPEHRVCVVLNSDAKDRIAMGGAKLFMSEIEWVSFKNSVLSADAKMSRRRDG